MAYLYLSGLCVYDPTQSLFLLRTVFVSDFLLSEYLLLKIIIFCHAFIFF